MFSNLISFGNCEFFELFTNIKTKVTFCTYRLNYVNMDILCGRNYAFRIVNNYCKFYILFYLRVQLILLSYRSNNSNKQFIISPILMPDATLPDICFSFSTGLRWTQGDVSLSLLSIVRD